MFVLTQDRRIVDISGGVIQVNSNAVIYECMATTMSIQRPQRLELGRFDSMDRCRGVIMTLWNEMKEGAFHFDMPDV